jgi:hypothetical protein
MNFLRRMACISFLFCPSLVLAAKNGTAADFPPGVFTDGGRYSLTDFNGKVLVLIFVETRYPDNKKKVAEWNKLVEQYREKPVRFIADLPRNTLAEAQKYVRETGMEMPAFADNLNIMEVRYGQRINMDEARAYRIIGPKGNVIGHTLTSDELDKDIADLSWRFKDKEWDPKLKSIVELLEWNQYQPAVKQLMPLGKNRSTTPLALSAHKLWNQVESEGEQWKTDADNLAATDPVAAYDLYVKVATVFATDKLAISVAKPLKALKTQKAVTDELAARAAYDQLYNTIPRATPVMREQAATYCKGIATQYPDAPTGKKADTLATDIGLATLTGT